MNLKEFRDFIEDKLNKYKFEESVRNSIKEQNMEVEEKYRINENQATIIINQNWNNLLSIQYDNVKSKMSKKDKDNYDSWVKKIDELELIDGLNNSFSEF